MATIGTGYNTLHSRMSFATIGGQIYGANDWDKMFVWNGVTAAVSAAGVEQPPQTWAPSPSTASGTATAGKHGFRYRYKNSETEYISNPSNAISVTSVAGSTQLTFAVASSGTGNINTSSDGKVDKIILEATIVDGGTFFTALEVDNGVGNAVFDISDLLLGENRIDYTDAGHGTPPYFRVVKAWEGRLWGLGRKVEQIGTVAVTNTNTGVTGTSTTWTDAAIGRMFHVDGDTASYEIASVGGATALTLDKAYAGSTASGKSYTIRPKNPNLLFCSEALLPESWSALSFAIVLKSTNDVATAMLPLGSMMLICGSHSIEKFTFTNEPFLTVEGRLPDGQLFSVSNIRGAANHNCLIEVEGTVYGFDNLGVWLWNGAKPVHISKEIDWRLKFNLSTSTYSRMPHMSWHPRDRIIRLHVSQAYGSGVEEDPGMYYEYAVDTQQWSEGVHHTAMACSTAFSTERYGSRVLYGDVVGYYWEPDAILNYLDGVLQHDLTTGAPSLVVHRVKGTVAASPTPQATGFTLNETGLDISTSHGGHASFATMAGAPCYSVGLGETAPVATNTANAVTIHSDATHGVGFSTAPAAGSTVYFGWIPCFFQTAWLTMSEHWEKADPRYIHLFFEPGGIDSDSEVFVRIIVNPRPQRGNASIAAAGPLNLTGFTGWATRSEDGVSFTAGQANILVQMDTSGTGAEGYRKIPIGTESWRNIALEVGLAEPLSNTWYGPVIHRIEIDGYTYESPPDHE